jgi:hypothetical protein
MKKTGFIVLFLLIIYGCKKVNPSEFSPNLIGEWSWISSCGGLSYKCYTPKATNHNIKLVFTTDSLFKTFQNDTLKSSARFQTYVLPPLDMPGTTNVIKFNSSNQLKFSIARDTLFLNDFCCDGFNSTYKRIK